MATETITIEVDSEAARLFKDASPQEQERMQALVGVLFKEFAETRPRPLRDIVSDIGAKARERGMTPEILRSILD
jgi:hypothetical protein